MSGVEYSPIGCIATCGHEPERRLQVMQVLQQAGMGEHAAATRVITRQLQLVHPAKTQAWPSVNGWTVIIGPRNLCHLCVFAG